LCLFFFFQAEDGIRDFHVTGVQTCALPISDELTGGNSNLTVANLNEAATAFANTDVTGAELETLTDTSNADSLHTHSTEENLRRSEERRVGKECRSRGAQ